uniref:Uncharacterized protein n=1 Tax=Cacopsylla melanoneura TaxID=428564 RepID=A0A8D8RYQ6_9HEMI
MMGKKEVSNLIHFLYVKNQITNLPTLLFDKISSYVKDLVEFYVYLPTHNKFLRKVLNFSCYSKRKNDDPGNYKDFKRRECTPLKRMFWGLSIIIIIVERNPSTKLMMCELSILRSHSKLFRV